MKEFTCPYFVEDFICVLPLCMKDENFTTCSGTIDGCRKVQKEDGSYFDERVLNALVDWVLEE